jgi:hypothetical protein
MIFGGEKSALALKLGLGLKPTSMASATNLENQGSIPAPTDMP